jgi:hypothetical protein
MSGHGVAVVEPPLVRVPRIRRITQAAGRRLRAKSPSADTFPAPLDQPDASELFGRFSQHCTVVGVDINGFGHCQRDNDVQLHVRSALYRLLAHAFDDAEVDWKACHHEDRGDGALIIVPPAFSTETIIEMLIWDVPAGVRRHNKMASDPAKIQLRVAVHRGHVYRDQHGIAGQAVQLLFRLLDAQAFKRALVASLAHVGVVASDYLYDEVIRHGPGRIDPDAFRRLQVRNKETRTRAWLHLSLSSEPPLSQSA